MEVVLNISKNAGATPVRLHLNDSVHVPESDLAELLHAALGASPGLKVCGIALRIASIVPADIRPPGAREDAAIVLPLSSLAATPEYFASNARTAQWVALYQYTFDESASQAEKSFYLNEGGIRVHISDPNAFPNTGGESQQNDSKDGTIRRSASHGQEESQLPVADESSLICAEGRGRPQSAASSDRSFGGRRLRPVRTEGRGRPLTAVPSDKLHGGKQLRPTRREGTGRPLSASPSDRPPMYQPSPDGETNRKKLSDANAWVNKKVPPGRPSTAPATGPRTINRTSQRVDDDGHLSDAATQLRIRGGEVRQAWGDEHPSESGSIDDSASIGSLSSGLSMQVESGSQVPSLTGSLLGSDHDVDINFEDVRNEEELSDSEDDYSFSIEEQNITQNPDGSFSALEVLETEKSEVDSDGTSFSDVSSDSASSSESDNGKEDWHHRKELFDTTIVPQGGEDWRHRHDLFDSSGIGVSAWANDDPSEDFRTSGNIRKVGLGPL